MNLDPGFTSAQVYGNIADRRSCDAGVSYSYNVFSGATCGTGDKQASLSSLFLDGDPSDGNMNLHLRTGVAAADSGDPNRYPTADVDGQARPLGGRSDSGADEAS